jgi:hypothetical protein
MTLYFKKARNFERHKFFEDFEHGLVPEVDIYTVVGADDEIDEDVITDREAGFVKGYMSA